VLAGTFNHFAKDLGMYPLSTAIAAIRAGTVAKVDLGEVNGKIFVNTASVGAYTDFVTIRERYEHRIGKPLAAVVAAVKTLGTARAVRVRVRDLDGETVDARFSLLFLGNGRYEPRGFAPVHRATLDDARLDLRVLGVSRLGSRARVFVDLFTGRISRNRRYQEFSDAEFDLELLDGPYRIARDGEVGEEVDHLRARACARPHRDRARRVRALTQVAGAQSAGGRRIQVADDREHAAVVVSIHGKAQCVIDVRGVLDDRLLGQHQGCRDPGVAASLCHESEHLQLPRGEPTHRTAEATGPGEHQLDDLRVERGSARRDPAKVGGERAHIGDALLQQIADSPAWAPSSSVAYRRCTCCERTTTPTCG
jgi:hypothetical protein